MKALVLGHSCSFRQMLSIALKDLGVDAISECCTDAAINCLSNENIDFIVMESQLSDTDALAFCRKLRGYGQWQAKPILLLLANLNDSNINKALEAGITEVLLKRPQEELKVLIKSYIDRLYQKISGNVLLVEDSKSTAFKVTQTLNQIGLNVVCCDNVDSALSAMNDSKFDLLIVDVVLQGEMSGLSLVRKVRKLDSECCNVPILGLSSYNDFSRKVEMLRQGANDFALKPVLEEEFLARVSNLINYKKMFDQVQEHKKILWESSIKDHLTGLYNRSYLTDYAKQCFSGDLAADEPCSLLVIDLDHFKQINDTHGHDTGDQVLQAIGDKLQTHFSGENICSRFGGEEFVVLLKNCAMDSAIQQAKDLLKAICTLRPGGIDITASIGVSTVESSNSDFKTLFKQADEKLYLAKASGRNKVCPD